MFNVFYGGGSNRPNRVEGSGNVAFTCACTGGQYGMTVQVFASNIREARRKCQKRAEQISIQLGTNINCTSTAPTFSGR
jgi:hypothetical protein